MTTRQDIVDALNAARIPFGKSVVKASVQRPTALTPGQAWPQYVLDRHQPSGQFELTWQVWLILPTSEPASVTWFDESWPLLAEALRPEMYVTRFEPIVIPAGEGSLFGVLISGESE